MSRTVLPVAANNVGARVASAKYQAVPVLGDLVHRGHRGVLSSAPKVGKSTYLSWKVAITPEARPLLYLTEMSDHQWAPLLDYWTPEQRDDVYFIFKDQVRGLDWEQIVGVLTESVKADAHVVVIVDTARTFFRLKKGEWNDPACVSECVDRYDDMLAEGAGVLTAHHDRKSGGAHGEGMSGSNSFAGAVDTIVEMSRIGEGRKRRLRFDTRWAGVPDEVVIEWQPDGFTFTETEKAEGAGSGFDPTRLLLEAIEKAGAPATFEAIMAAWPWRIGKTKLRAIIRAALAAGAVVETGSGQRGHALRYSSVSPAPLQRPAAESNTAHKGSKIDSSAHKRSVRGCGPIDVACSGFVRAATTPRTNWAEPPLRLAGGAA